MTIAKLRLEMDRYWDDVYREGLDLKDSYRPLVRLNDLYETFDDGERAMANQVLSEWLVSAREDKRFAAMSLVSDFRITCALPALEELVTRLEESKDPGARYERDKANRIIGELHGNST